MISHKRLAISGMVLLSTMVGATGCIVSGSKAAADESPSDAADAAPNPPPQSDIGVPPPDAEVPMLDLAVPSPEMPEEPEPSEPETPAPTDPGNEARMCPSPDRLPEERRQPNANACNPLSDETHLALFSGDSAMEAMRLCTFEGATDRRPYTAVRIPRALIDAWDPGEETLTIELTQTGVEVWMHRNLFDGATPCSDMPMGDLAFGEGLTREGESAEGSLRLYRGAGGRYFAYVEFTFQYYGAEHGAQPFGIDSGGFGVETLW